jgi:3-hydroxymyristoyl/3-hydroxydecanoyl-(acyl carrier protein) dehydratase
VWTTLGALRIRAEGGGDDAHCTVSGGHVLEPTPLADVLVLEDGPDAARRFRLLGRANDLIHVAGKRSSLAHLNFHLNRIDGVEDGAFWLPDDAPDGVVRPVAFVVAPTLSAAQVVAALRERLEAVFVPRRVVHVQALPREATGKLTVATLRQFALQHLPLAAGSAGVLGAAGAATAPMAAAATTVHADGSATALWPIAADHPAFAGHFPGRPLLPGVVLLSLVMETLANAPALQALLGAPGAALQVDNVKFLAPVAPGSSVLVTLRTQGSGVAFELAHGPRTVARGQLRPGSAGTPARA